MDEIGEQGEEPTKIEVLDLYSYYTNNYETLSYGEKERLFNSLNPVFDDSKDMPLRLENLSMGGAYFSVLFLTEQANIKSKNSTLVGITSAPLSIAENIKIGVAQKLIFDIFIDSYAEYNSKQSDHDKYTPKCWGVFNIIKLRNSYRLEFAATTLPKAVFTMRNWSDESIDFQSSVHGFGSAFNDTSNPMYAIRENIILTTQAISIKITPN